ncbi:hypothetical protein ACRQ5Q_15355 [Bradyrhizobium sp. PMVTL-01]|uniref:hypothetical protein n=1 Tax=Bradyrhizobium sp. PMVTL-01 TaxID=3434999 RepID=UPI003F7249CA
MDFHHFRAPVEARFNAMTKLDLFCVEVHGDELWERYLASFPPGSDPIYLKRTQHDCNCCKKFIRDLGGVVAIKDGKLVTIWDVECQEPAYQAVADEMSALVKSRAIKEPFLHYEKQVGTEKSRKLVDGKTVETFSHFYAQIPWRPNTGKVYFCEGKDIATTLGKARDLRNLFLRGLETLTQDALDTVLELIANKSLYRGEQYEAAIKAFVAKKADFLALSDSREQQLYAWANYDKVHPSVAGIRNTAVGTLLIDLSEGVDLEAAVRKFESSIMAPANYKRPTALVSQAMVDKARETIAQLGLLESMERRHARLSDVSIEDVLWADRSARKVMGDDIFDGVATKVPASVKSLDKVETIGIEAFLRDILPKAETIEVMLENKHTSNLMSLIAPKHASAKPLFKWGNGFSWTYNGEVADSIKERVKRAGGNITGDLCCRLAWFNNDDLDFHMIEPGKFGRRYEIMYTNRRSLSPAGGMLDVDMNGGDGLSPTRTPVENIFYKDRRTMTEGEYTLFVRQFSRRETIDPGFDVEIDWLGEVKTFHYAKAVTGDVMVARMHYSAAKGIEIIESLPSTQASREVWGLKTQDFHRVSTVMLSPNYWAEGNGTGNKHFFFMLDGARNEDRPRGFFNEFLIDELAPHRKVIEIVGSKAKVETTADQLSGLGFSSTQRNDLLARVKGGINRTVRVTF